MATINRLMERQKEQSQEKLEFEAEMICESEEWRTEKERLQDRLKGLRSLA